MKEAQVILNRLLDKFETVSIFLNPTHPDVG